LRVIKLLEGVALAYDKQSQYVKATLANEVVARLTVVRRRWNAAVDWCELPPRLVRLDGLEWEFIALPPTTIWRLLATMVATTASRIAPIVGLLLTTRLARGRLLVPVVGRWIIKAVDGYKTVSTCN
jgi:hypothetical protein